MDGATAFGLLGNYERSRVINGKAEIQSSKKGTIVKIEIPGKYV